MQVCITRRDKALPLPVYETGGAVGFDLICREATTIEPRELGIIPANVIVKVPKGYFLMLTLRSSTPRKWGLLMPHGIGVIDNDYCGAEDEIKIQVLNFREFPVTIPRGARIAQGIFVKTSRARWKEASPANESRGGFGSTSADWERRRI